MRHVEGSIEEHVAELTGFDRELSAVTFRRVGDGVFTPVSDDVEPVVGRPARSRTESAATVDWSRYGH